MNIVLKYLKPALKHAILLLILAPTTSFAATYYVDPVNGDSVNCNGTSSSTYPGSGGPGLTCAFATIAAGDTASTFGDTVYLKKGSTFLTGNVQPNAGTTWDSYGTSGANPIIDYNHVSNNVVFINSTNAVTFRNIDVRNGNNTGLFVNLSSNITLENVNSLSNTSRSFYINSSTNVTMSDLTSGTSNIPFQIADTTGTCTNCIATDSSTNTTGFSVTGASTITCTNCTAYNNDEDGFNSSNTSSLTCINCLSYNNGAVGDASAGDGYTAHNTATLILKNSIAYGNFKSGVAVTDDSNGEISGCSIYNNTEPSQGSGWGSDTGVDVGIGINSTGTWVVKKNITYGHGREIIINNLSATVASNNNLFYDSLGGNAFDYNGTAYNFSGYKTAASQDADSINLNPLFNSVGSNDFTLQVLSPAIDSGVSISGLTTDYLGNPIYGTPDIGAYEYQPPYTIGTDPIPATGSVRLYADGQYRTLTATSSSAAAELTATPTGNWGSTDYRQYMDLVVDNWDSTTRTWTASSSIATTTVFTLSGLTPSTEHTLTVDGLTSATITGPCATGTCTSASDGTLVVTYTGTWSTHTFSVVENPPVVTNTSGGSSSTRVKKPTTTAPDTTLRNSLLARIEELKALIATLTNQLKPSNPYHFTRQINVGDDHKDVLHLQQKLNQLGYTIASTGAGSPGNETTYYGPLTTAALKKFQCAEDIVCAGTPDTTGYGNFGPLTRERLGGL